MTLDSTVKTNHLFKVFFHIFTNKYDLVVKDKMQIKVNLVSLFEHKYRTHIHNATYRGLELLIIWFRRRIFLLFDLVQMVFLKMKYDLII